MAPTAKKVKKKKENYLPANVTPSSQVVVAVSPQDAEETNLVNQIRSQFDYYKAARRGRVQKWSEIWKNYISWLDTTDNPYLSNLFIPKTHEAVELLAAFLSGPNQSITAEGEGAEDVQKGVMVAKWLEYMWRKTIKARHKIIVWLKQAILFGNGIIHVYWDEEAKHTEVEVRDVRDVFFDYYKANLQDSDSVILRLYFNPDKIKEDETYDYKNSDGTLNRILVVPEQSVPEDQESKFSSYDASIETPPPKGVVPVLECTTDEEIVTIAPTALGWKIIRKVDNPTKDADGEQYKPFVKLRLKNNPLINRAYDTGAVEPTLYIQRSFNGLVNEFLDNVELVNNNMWKKKRGANVSPMDLIMRPGGTIDVDNMEDIAPLQTPDIKQSLLESIKFLDSEFQQASMVVNLLKSIPDSNTATEANLSQQNSNTLLSVVDGNVKDALSEVGQMVLDCSLANIEEDQSIKIFDGDDKAVIATFKPSEIKGKHDIQVSADRPQLTSTADRQKQLVQLAGVIAKDSFTMSKYPDILTKLYKKWLELGGEGDVSSFFEEAKVPGAGQVPPATPGQPAGRVAGL